ncbi:MAG TPA: class III extradiol ring-cleavage dioxygenase [Xanthobacteraceae bacterium]|nr:class III extradiol ring-cleavage dioxygenase [Xanthobacteraceae bacterium]
MRTPTLFISHGSPMLAIEPSPAREFLIDYGRQLARPRAIVIASAHFGTSRPAVVGDAKPGMIYDFGGFPDALREIVYPAPGDPVVAMKVAGLLEAAGFAPAVVAQRGFDHGAWVPLSLMFPDADVPVVQLALQPRLGPAHHVALGRAIASLKTEDILVIGSGSASHNLQAFWLSRGDDGAPPEWVQQFDGWVRERVQAGDVDALVAYRDRAPFARDNHPSEEHFLPLHVAIGAAGEGARGELIHSSHANGVLSMDAYVFS